MVSDHTGEPAINKGESKRNLKNYSSHLQRSSSVLSADRINEQILEKNEEPHISPPPSLEMPQDRHDPELIVPNLSATCALKAQHDVHDYARDEHFDFHDKEPLEIGTNIKIT